jgi:hypothetical protein
VLLLTLLISVNLVGVSKVDGGRSVSTLALESMDGGGFAAGGAMWGAGGAVVVCVGLVGV